MPEKKKVDTSADNRVADAIQHASYHGFDKVTGQFDAVVDKASNIANAKTKK